MKLVPDVLSLIARSHLGRISAPSWHFGPSPRPRAAAQDRFVAILSPAATLFFTPLESKTAKLIVFTIEG